MKRILHVWQIRDAVRLTHRIQTAADDELKREGVRLALLTVLSSTTVGLVVEACKEGVYDLKMRQALLTAGQSTEGFDADSLNRQLNQWEFLKKGMSVIPISSSTVRVNYTFNAPDRRAYRAYLARIRGVEGAKDLDARTFELQMAEEVNLALMEEVEARASFKI